MEVVPVGVEPGGFMELPPDPAIAGWYRFGPDPWSPDGNTVISAHIDAPEYPIGPFAALRDLAVGLRSHRDRGGRLDRRLRGGLGDVLSEAGPADGGDLRSRGHRRTGADHVRWSIRRHTGRYADNVVVVAAPRA